MKRSGDKSRMDVTAAVRDLAHPQDEFGRFAAEGGSGGSGFTY